MNLRLELSMIEKEFLIGFKGLYLFLDYKDNNFLSQAFINSTSVSQYKP